MADVKKELVDKLAELDINALIDCLSNKTLRYDPSILARARAFLKDNKLLTKPESNEMRKIEALTRDLPNFTNDNDSFEC